MRSSIRIVLCAMVSFAADSVIAETPAEIFQQMDSRKRASFEGVDNFSVMKTTMGLCTLEHFEKATTESVDGRGSVEYMRLVPITEVTERNAPDSPLSGATPAQLEAAAKVLREEAPQVDMAVRNELQGARLPAGLSGMLMNRPAGKPWLSPMPGDMMNNYAMMLDGAAQGKKQDAQQKALAEQEAQQDPLAAVADSTRIAGNETVNNRLAIHLVAEDLNYTQSTNGQDFALNTLHLWVDAEHYVPLKMQMDGTANDGGQMRDMRIEREDMGYEKVDGCDAMFEPRRSVMRISGILNAKEQAQMLEAKEKLAEFETQMASMPASQRDMIMRQLGPQMEMFRNMAEGQGIEVVSLTVGMRCNAGLPGNQEYMQTVPGVSQAACIGFVGDGAP